MSIYDTNLPCNDWHSPIPHAQWPYFGPPKTACKGPVCEGRGTVPPNFYSGSTVTNARSEPCRSCDGKGVVWTP